MRLVVIALVMLALVVPVLFAASYSAQIVNTGSYGSEYRFTWNQGCPRDRLGPNECHDNQPMWCPLNSQGRDTSTQDRMTENCGVCDCAHGSGTYCDENDPIECQACDVSCDDLCDPGWSSCSFDYADGCNVINVVCNYEPEFIGYGRLNNCEGKDGRNVRGVPMGGGQYRDCVVDTRVCNDREMRVVSSDYLGTVFDFCPDGYTDEYGVFRTPPGTGTAGPSWMVYSTYASCRRDADCWPEETDPDPDPGESECTIHADCDDGDVWSCSDDKWTRTQSEGRCDYDSDTGIGTCYQHNPYAISGTDCSGSCEIYGIEGTLQCASEENQCDCVI